MSFNSLILIAKSSLRLFKGSYGKINTKFMINEKKSFMKFTLIIIAISLLARPLSEANKTVQ